MSAHRAENDDWREALRRTGRRLTPQRELVLRAVEDLGHATPDEVLAHVRNEAGTVNLSTIYRNLEVLQEMGLVRHAHLSDRVATYHSVKEHTHFHVVCRSCKEVLSVSPEVAESFADDLAAQHGFIIDVGHLAVFGQCASCAGGAR